jgi:hypothetical protein
MQQPALTAARDRATAGAERPQLLERDHRIGPRSHLADPPIEVIQPYLDVFAGYAYRSITVWVIQPYATTRRRARSRSITRSIHAGSIAQEPPCTANRGRSDTISSPIHEKPRALRSRKRYAAER